MKYFLAFLISFSGISTNASTSAIGEPNIVWEKRKIHVCWHTGEYNFEAEVKKAVQTIVEQEFTIERVGITFFGWEDCSTLTAFEFDLMIDQDSDLVRTNPTVEPFRKMKAEGQAVLGQGSLEQIQTETNRLTKEEKTKRGYFNRHLTSPTMYLMYRPVFRLFESSFKDREELQFTALHEFGHVAGLRHEHIRAEVKNDPNCKNLVDFKNDEPLLDTAINYEEYDPNSIMNYCWGATLATVGNVVSALPNLPDKTLYTEIIIPKSKKKTYQIKVGLSAKDIATLNQLYPKL